MAELSRQELIQWVNDLLQMNYTKVEQMGSGAALCQIFDSIYGDVALNRVKFNTNQQYEYVNNFKVLQKCFTDHSVDKVIPVDRLINCKFQDNLEFLQWVKKYWDNFYPGGAYDALARRKSGGSKPGSSTASAGMKKALSNSSVEHQSPKPARRVPQTTGGQAARATASPAISRTAPARAVMSKSNSNMPGFDAAALNELNKQVTQLQVTVDGLERERDFYFAKLRDVEILVQNLVEGGEVDMESDLGKFAKQVQTILYSTEEGFEIPQDENQAPAADEVATY